MRWFILAVAVLHLAFMLGELVPWSSPMLLGRLSEKSLKAVNEAHHGVFSASIRG